MPATISRLLMCFGLLVVAVIVHIPTFMFFEARGDDTVALTIAGVVSNVVFALGWLLNWRGMVEWSPARVWLTFALIPISLAFAGLIYALMFAIVSWSPEDLGVIMGTFAWGASWMIGSAVIWRENVKERGKRLRRLGIHAVACPDCGYNLTGLREAKCPECGAAYTLDQLYACIAESHTELGGE